MLQVLRVDRLRGSISGLCTDDTRSNSRLVLHSSGTSGLAAVFISEFVAVDTPFTSSLSSISVALQVLLVVIRPLVLLVRRALAVPNYSQYAQHARGVIRRCMLRPSLHRCVDKIAPVVTHKTFTDDPTSGTWSEFLLRGVNSSTYRVPAVFRYTASTGSISRVCTTAVRVLPNSL